jgi:hypothetical protein
VKFAIESCDLTELDCSLRLFASTAGFDQEVTTRGSKNKYTGNETKKFHFKKLQKALNYDFLIWSKNVSFVQV